MWITPIEHLVVTAPFHELFQRRIAVILRIDTDGVSNSGRLPPDLPHLFSKAAVIEEPGRRGIVQVLHIRIKRIAVIQWYPHATRAHQPEHAQQDAPIVGRKNRHAIFVLQTAGPHRAGDSLAGSLRLAVGKPSCAIDDRNPVRKRFRSLIEIVDRPHSSWPLGIIFGLIRQRFL